MCSCACASPVYGSSSEPASTFSQVVTTGASRSRSTTTRRPFGSVRCATVKPLSAGAGCADVRVALPDEAIATAARAASSRALRALSEEVGLLVAPEPARNCFQFTEPNIDTTRFGSFVRADDAGFLELFH